MTRQHIPPPELVWLESGQPFPPLSAAWGDDTPMPGLLAAGGELDEATLAAAYAHTAFPWFSAGQPLLWWSPDPRMVLATEGFRLHRSLRQAIRRFRADPDTAVRFDTAFDRVIEACAQSPRVGQDGTWIGADMIAAYQRWHRAGFVHSVEVWRGPALLGGLYAVAIGHAVFGESMFTHETDASKIALAALVAFCRAHGISHIDCQQQTQHLASLGAAPVPRATFAAHVRRACQLAAPEWKFDPVYWAQLDRR